MILDICAGFLIGFAFLFVCLMGVSLMFGGVADEKSATSEDNQ